MGRETNVKRSLISRRFALAGMAGCLSTGARAAPASLPDAPAILVAGPPGGRLDQWASLIAEPLGRGLLSNGAVRRENVGGADGVTGANQFEARTTPDGGTALLAPGAAMLSWLTGDMRVRFDAGRWVPLWGADVSAVVASRGPVQPVRRLRMAVHSVAGPELMALLALELMHIEVEPVRADTSDPTLFERADLDLLMLRGRKLRSRASALALGGWQPAFGFGVIGADGELARDPAYADLPIAQELIGASRPNSWPLLPAALRAVTAAATLDLALVLPQPAPAAMVAWWRRGCGALLGAPAVQAEASKRLMRPIGAGRIAANIGRVTVDAPVLLDLRRWLADRYEWRPS